MESMLDKGKRQRRGLGNVFLSKHVPMPMQLSFGWIPAAGCLRSPAC